MNILLEQRREIRRVVYEPAERWEAAEHLRFWREVEEGKGEGILGSKGPRGEG